MSGCRMHERKILFWWPIKFHYSSPFVGEWSSVKYLGLTAGDSSSPTPSLFLLTSSPQFFAHPIRGPSLARFFACLFDLRLEKERKRLLRRLYPVGWPVAFSPPVLKFWSLELDFCYSEAKLACYVLCFSTEPAKPPRSFSANPNDVLSNLTRMQPHFF